MDYSKSREEISGYIRLALPLMSRYNISMTPQNYAVWYKYVSGADAQLSSTIDAMREGGEEFGEAENDSLYRRFCAEKDESELRRIREDLQRILLTILREVTELTGQTEEYETFVSASVNTLSDDASVLEIRNVIGEIMDKTKTLGRFGKTIKEKLGETTQTLEVLRKDFEQVKAEAFVDFLTGVPNRKAFDNEFSARTGEVAVGGNNLSLMLIDIDEFKRFNDQHGHLIGDEVLRFVARKIKETVRGRDFLARFGGEEFAVILPQTPIAGAEVVAESVRSLFARTKLKAVATSKDLGIITVSIGVAVYRPGELPESFIHRCDKALYRAKSAGRNRVEKDSSVINESGSHEMDPMT